ncbi:predicted protein, partial [Nematostella vectensis]
CPAGWVRLNRSCYKADQTIMNWADARTACGKLGGDLVKITSEQENTFVYELSRKQAPSRNRMWIGLKRNPTTPTKFEWFDSSRPLYTKWWTGEPNNHGASEDCGEIYTFPLPDPRAKHWNDLPCDLGKVLMCGFICEKSAYNK